LTDAVRQLVGDSRHLVHSHEVSYMKLFLCKVLSAADYLKCRLHITHIQLLEVPRETP
jgi:hypothetical protein